MFSLLQLDSSFSKTRVPVIFVMIGTSTKSTSSSTSPMVFHTNSYIATAHSNFFLHLANNPFGLTRACSLNNSTSGLYIWLAAFYCTEIVNSLQFAWCLLNKGCSGCKYSLVMRLMVKFSLWHSWRMILSCKYLEIKTNKLPICHLLLTLNRWSDQGIVLVVIKS